MPSRSQFEEFPRFIVVESVQPLDDRRGAADLERSKEFIEDRGRASGAYRGTIQSPDAR